MHVAYIVGVGIPVWWKVDSNSDWEVGKEFLELNPMGIIADRGYWVWDFLYECRKKDVYAVVRPRGKKGEEFLEVFGQISEKRWEIEHFFQRLKGEIVLSGINLKTPGAKVKIRLLGEVVSKLWELWRKEEMDTFAA